MREIYETFICTLNDLDDIDFEKVMVVSFEQCTKLFENCQRSFHDSTDKRAETNSDEDEEAEIQALDSASQTSVIKHDHRFKKF